MKPEEIRIRHYFGTGSDGKQGITGVEFTHPKGYGFLGTADQLREAGNGSLIKGIRAVRRRYASLTDEQLVVMAQQRDMQWIYDTNDEDP